jgi:NAD(P)H dehydrogenase (quinone)
MIVITGASGQLGRLVIEALLHKLPASEIVAAVRTPAKVSDLAARGVQVRQADYTQPATLDAAFQGADKLLLISSSEVGQRVPQHRAVIDAAQRAGVKLLAYTSLLHADVSPLGLAAEHQATEALLRASGLPHVILRNGWYTENYAASVPAALAHGVLLGSAGTGRVYELAGDTAYTLAELAAEITTQSGKEIAYKDLPEADYKAILLGAGLPEGLAALLADSDVGASKGGLFDDSRQLSQLIGRPTTRLATSIAPSIPKESL